MMSQIFYLTMSKYPGFPDMFLLHEVYQTISSLEYVLLYLLGMVERQ